MTIIGVTGLVGSGKSTVANYLVENHGFTRLSFAAPLKKMLRTLDPIIGNTIIKSEIESVVHPTHLSELTETENELKAGPFGVEYRRLMQFLGTECIRAVDPDFWTNAAKAQLSNPDGRYVFDDIRFPNEAKVITDHNPMGLWNIQRPSTEVVGDRKLHVSEQHAGIMGEFAQLVNDDLDGLHRQVDLHLANCTYTSIDDLYRGAIKAMQNFQQNQHQDTYSRSADE